MHPTSTLAGISPRATDAEVPEHKNSSLFTFLIALLILFCASGALVLRTLVRRRRLRNGMQVALDAGILLPPLPVHKPELSEVWVRLISNAQDWNSLMPLCATVVQKDAADSGSKHKARTHTAYRPSPAVRFMDVLRHRHPVTVAPVDCQTSKHEDVFSQPSTVQVTVLVAMPTEQHTIPPYDPSLIDSSKGKRRDSSINHDDADSEGVPDVMFGISALTWSRTDSHDL